VSHYISGVVEINRGGGWSYFASFGMFDKCPGATYLRDIAQGWPHRTTDASRRFFKDEGADCAAGWVPEIPLALCHEHFEAIEALMQVFRKNGYQVRFIYAFDA
jgi:hypothetical protein